MAADLYRSALVQQTRAALHALEQALLSEQELTSQAVAVLLERWGDALRLGESVPPKLRAKADEIELDTLGAALRQRIEELDAWTIPEPDDEASDARLGFALCRRDETESLLQGLTRLMLARRGLPADVAGLETLCEGLAEFDAELGRRVHRRQAEAALGIRVALHDENTWLASLPLPEPTGVAESTQGAEFVLSGA